MKCAVRNCRRNAKFLFPLSGIGWVSLCENHAKQITELGRDDIVLDKKV